MITINVIENQMSGSYGDKVFSVPFNGETMEKMKALQSTYEGITTMKEHDEIMTAFAELTKVDYKTTVETACKHIHVNKATEQFFLKSNNVVSSIPMPKALVDRILASMDKGIDFMPLIKMWTRFLRNPVLRKKMQESTEYGNLGENFCERFFNFINLKYVHPALKKEFIEEIGLSEEVATERATMYQMKITNEGLLNGYKVSTEILHKYDAETGEEVNRYARSFDPDTGEIVEGVKPENVEDRIFQPAIMGTGGDPFYCEGVNGFDKPGHFIRVGCTHRLESWNQVDTRDERSCVKGLHFGGLMYISRIAGEIHNIFVDPMHVGAVPDDSTGAIRCIQYFVHSSLAGVNGSIYHSSTYASKTDKEWEEMRAAAVKEFSDLKSDADIEAKELSSI
tara:strand:- start:2637 stop:3821 length:1185 start_codon:yes stop_codon:yes gene_type:complete